VVNMGKLDVSGGSGGYAGVTSTTKSGGGMLLRVSFSVSFRVRVRGF
jgi:hypothetical protein